jgi:hypothetical protein
MTIARPSCFQIPQDKIQQCVNSGALSSLMITTCGIAALVTKKVTGHIDGNIGPCINIAPYIGARVFLHLIPETDSRAIYFGAVIGMGVTHLIGPTPIGYATGSLVGGLAGSAIAAARVRVLRQE